MDEPKEISGHLVRVVAFVQLAGDWVDAKQIAHGTKMVERTVRAHARRMADLGIFDLVPVFPAHRYRFSKQAQKKQRMLMNRIRESASMFGCKVV